jgi:hypothetical protein
MSATPATLWDLVRTAWLNAAAAPQDPRLAEEARLRPAVTPRPIPPLVGAWLR